MDYPEKGTAEYTLHTLHIHESHSVPLSLGVTLGVSLEPLLDEAGAYVNCVQKIIEGSGRRCGIVIEITRRCQARRRPEALLCKRVGKFDVD